MRIQSCSFSIKHPEQGFIHGRYRDGKVSLAGTSGFPDENNRYTGSSYHSKKDQAIYLDLLDDAVKIQGSLFE